MTRSRQALPLLALWVLVVAAASALAWAAISQAGREVTAGNPTRTLPAPNLAAVPLTPTTGGGLASSAPQPAPAQPPTSGAATVPPGPGSVAPGSVSSLATRTGSATRTEPPVRPPSTNGPVASLTPVRASLSVVGGSVGMSCRGNQLVLDWATPRNGWSFTVKREHGGVEVRFAAARGGNDEGDDGSEHARSEVEGQCVNGRPVLRQK